MSNAQIKAFNQQYHLDINLKNFSFISVEEFKAREKQSFSGKTKSVWSDIIKRFFKNKWNLFFFILLLTLIILMYVGPLLSNYNPKTRVGPGTVKVLMFQKPYWVKDWNHITTNMEISEFWNYYDNDNIGIFDQADIISNEIIYDTNGNATQMHVEYINKFAPETILGTDSDGKDVWSRLFKGAQWSLELAIFVATIETVMGIALGIYIGFHVGSRLDTLSMRFIEIFNSVPPLLWMFIFAMIIGTSFFSMATVMIFIGWVGPLYSARMFTLKTKDAEFIKAAESIGVSKTKRLYFHILPNIIGRLLVSFVHRIPGVIFMETTMIFLGMKVGGDTGLSIGNLINDARSLDAINSNITYALSISSFLLIFSISLQIIANGIRDAFDPKTGV